MINVATWWVSLFLMGVASAVAVHYWIEVQRLKKRNKTLRTDLRDLEDELMQLRTTLAMSSPNVAGVLFTERKEPVPKKQIEAAHRELKKWVKEDGGR